MKERNHVFDFLCGLCIIRMIMLHIMIESSLSKTDWWQEIMLWSYFFMSFFFFKAGYFNKSMTDNTLSFIKTKAKSLLVPYVSWGIIGNIVYLSFAFLIFAPNNWFRNHLELSHLWTTASWYGNSAIWFLTSFFTMYIMAHFIMKVPTLSIPLPGNRKLTLSIALLVIIFPWISFNLSCKGNPLYFTLNNVFIGTFYFFLGRFWHKAIDYLGDRRKVFDVSAILVAIFIILNINYAGGYYMFSNKWTGGFLIVMIKVVTAMTGISGVLIALNMPRIPFINYIGKHSMVYFVSHYPIIYLYKFVGMHNMHTMRGNWTDVCILAAIIFTFATLSAPLIEKVPLLSGRFGNSKK